MSIDSSLAFKLQRLNRILSISHYQTNITPEMKEMERIPITNEVRRIIDDFNISTSITNLILEYIDKDYDREEFKTRAENILTGKENLRYKGNIDLLSKVFIVDKLVEMGIGKSKALSEVSMSEDEYDEILDIRTKALEDKLIDLGYSDSKIGKVLNRNKLESDYFNGIISKEN